jgi:hypothetical protein
MKFASCVLSLLFAVYSSSATANAERYTNVANKLVALINASDYPAIEKLFDKEMAKALPLEKTKEFFSGLSQQVGKIQKLDLQKSGAAGSVFLLQCERSALKMTLSLDADDNISGLYLVPVQGSDNAPKKNQTELSLPFKGRWTVFWGGDTKKLNYHHDVPAQRFAFDLLGVNEKGETYRGDGKKNEDYFCFGREIYAPAEGTVIEAIDGVRDNEPGVMNSYCLVGNCVLIQHRTNEFSVLAHFRQGSVAVKAGEQVKRGQLLGKCGNSGNSSEPHLHYHLQHSGVFQDALGIKPMFKTVAVTKDGETQMKSNYSPIKGEIISPD